MKIKNYKTMKKFLFAVSVLTITLFSCGKFTDEPKIIRDAVTDLDGNKYDAVQIGNQVWMAKNLQTTKVKNIHGETIQLQANTVNSFDDPFNGISYAYPYGDQENQETYGLLYSEWLLNEECGICLCPEGWHMPEASEWETLKSTVSELSGKKNKIAAYLCDDEGWKKSSNPCAGGNLNTQHRNFTGFSALPAGREDEAFPADNIGTYSDYFGRYAFFWCQDKSAYFLSYEFSRFTNYSHQTMHHSEEPNYFPYCSVRCVRD